MKRDADNKEMYDAIVALIGALGLNRPDNELIEDFGMLGLDAARRAKLAIRCRRCDDYGVVRSERHPEEIQDCPECNAEIYV